MSVPIFAKANFSSFLYPTNSFALKVFSGFPFSKKPHEHFFQSSPVRSEFQYAELLKMDRRFFPSKGKPKVLHFKGGRQIGKSVLSQILAAYFASRNEEVWFVSANSGCARRAPGLFKRLFSVSTSPIRFLNAHVLPLSLSTSNLPQHIILDDIFYGIGQKPPVDEWLQMVEKTGGLVTSHGDQSSVYKKYLRGAEAHPDHAVMKVPTWENGTQSRKFYEDLDHGDEFQP